MLKKIKHFLWHWPNGLVWKLTEKPTLRSRRKKFDLFIKLLNPKSDETILDVGVSSYLGRKTNFLEFWYANKHKITCLTNESLENFSEFRKFFPQVKLVFGNGLDLKFSDKSFDIVFSNAVVEHVGSRKNQKQFIYELTRVGKNFFISTPNYWFFLDSHSLLPFIHWLPRKYKSWLYKKLGRSSCADINYLNLLKPKEFLALFPKNIKVKLHKQRIFGLTYNLIAYA